jgi:glycosyltransferase involved in cell wall biosynthesis
LAALKEQNVLMILRSPQHGGTEKVVTQICRTLLPYVRTITICGADGFDLDEIKGLPIKFYKIPDIENKSVKTIFQVVRILIRVMRENHITIIHTHHRMAAIYALALSKMFKVTLINTAHGVFSDKKRITRFVYLHFNLIACGETVANNLSSYFGINKKKITVIRNSIESGNLINQDAIDLNRSNDERYICYVGRLSPEKGVKYLIQAMTTVYQQVSTAKLIIVGDGPEKLQLELLSKKLGLQDVITFFGYQAKPFRIISACDVLCLSSLTEGLPLTPLEAFFAGKPVVATNVGGTPEIVSDGVNGFLVKPKETKDLAVQLIKILTRDELRKKMGHTAKLTFEQRFSPDKFEKSLVDFYNSVLN